MPVARPPLPKRNARSRVLSVGTEDPGAVRYRGTSPLVRLLLTGSGAPLGRDLRLNAECVGPKAETLRASTHPASQPPARFTRPTMCTVDILCARWIY
jgi:hypothetical protein